jgi:hypothetical protein
MPFSDTKHQKDGCEVITSAEEWTYIRENWFVRAIESFPDQRIKAKASELVPGNFVKDIIIDIHESEIVIADLTGQKPNVYYELGIRHALRIGTIIITQDFQHLPSDLKSYSCFPYNYPKEAHLQTKAYGRFEADLHTKIRYVIGNSQKPDSPVSDFLKLDNYYRSRLFEEEKASIIKVVENLNQITNTFLTIYDEQLGKREYYNARRSLPFTFIDIELFHSYFTSYVNFPLKTINSEVLQPITNLLHHLRDGFIYPYQFWETATKRIDELVFVEYFAMLSKQRNYAVHIQEELFKALEEFKEYHL